MTPTENVTEATVTKVTKKVKRSLFNLLTWKKESKEKEIELPPAVKTMEEVLEAIGHDDSKLVAMYNKQKDRDAILEAKREMGGENLVSPKLISGIVGGFAAMFPLDSSVDAKAAKKKQNAQIGEFILATPAVHESLKTIAAAMAASAPDDEDEDEETEDNEEK